MEVVSIIHSTLATNDDKSSPIGVIVNIRDTKTKKANIVQYRSSKSKRVVRSALESELLAVVEGFNLGF